VRRVAACAHSIGLPWKRTTSISAPAAAAPLLATHTSSRRKASLIQVIYNPPTYTPTGPFVFPKSHSGTDFAWGIGVQAHVKMFGVRLEYEGFEVKNNTAHVASLSVFLNF
jgi:hypothetical protein